MSRKTRADMFLEADVDPRNSSSTLSGERTTLMDYLTYQRQTLELKCSGLDAADLARRSVEPSTMSLLGLVRHMAEVERSWFRRTMSGLDAPPRYFSDDDPDGDFDGAVDDPGVVEEAFDAWRSECEFTDQFVARAADLDVVGENRHGRVSLREVLVHMVEEYARHNGHADLLRERIDGRIGQ